MRSLIALIALASPATAWEFSPLPVCTLDHLSGDSRLTVTYDATASEPYAIEISSPDIAPAPVFGIRFSGGTNLTITTDRHSVEGSSVRVSDRGFGNVLNGIEFGDTATALLGNTVIPFSLEGADAPMQAFRACTETPVA